MIVYLFINVFRLMIINYYFAEVTIGFERTVYIVTEGVDANVELCAVLIVGELERQAVVTFSTSDGTATATG